MENGYFASSQASCLKVDEMRSFRKVLFPVICVVVLCGSATLWRIHEERTNEARRAQAVTESRSKAENGDAQAQYSLGNMYHHGIGVPPDYDQAACWYRKAAEQGLAKGQYNLGYVYQYGQGVPQDYAEAAQWYSKASDQGYASAQVNLARLYYLGQGVHQDYAEAALLYRRAADQGDARGEDGLGSMYYQGLGVQLDYAEAARWYQKAADQGLAKAQYDLGALYYQGRGVSQSRIEAKRWFYKAAEQGNQNAQRFLGAGLTTCRKIEIAIQSIAGILLMVGFLLAGKSRWPLRMGIAPGMLCIFSAGLSWYGYTHYKIHCLLCGFNIFTSLKWLLNAVLIALLVYITRTEEKADGRVAHSSHLSA
jgi:TPR repeat protein